MCHYILYRIGEFLSLRLPPFLTSLLVRTLSYLQYLLSRQDRVSIRENLQAIFPGIDKKLLQKHTKDVFWNFGRYLYVFFRFKKLGLAYIKENVEIEGRHYIDEALSLGRGLIVVSAHIGNWELGGAILSLWGYPVSAITLTHKYKPVNDFFDSKRASMGLRAIPLDKAGRAVLAALSCNEIVCILGDRDYTRGGIVLDLFGLPAMIPKGPAVFSLRNKTPLLVGFLIQEDRGKTRLIFNAPVRFTPAGDYEKDVRMLTELYLRQIEDCVRKYPGQWLMFRRFWL
jgi:KDO2-lipid IV(A) lauroyltransferase